MFILKQVSKFQLFVSLPEDLFFQNTYHLINLNWLGICSCWKANCKYDSDFCCLSDTVYGRDRISKTNRFAKIFKCSEEKDPKQAKNVLDL